MSYLLSRPTTVVLVGGQPGGSADLRRTLLEGTAADIAAAETRAGALDVLEAREDVGCVLVTDDPSVGSVPDCCRALRDARENVPIVAYVDPDTEIAEALATVRGCRYLPRTASDAILRETVDDAIETFEQRREEAAESSMFSTLLEDAETSIYVKDERGRHLRMADVPFSVDPAEAYGKTDLDIWGDETPQMAQKTYEDDLEVVNAGEPIFDQDERFGSGGEDFWSRTTKVPWRNGDGEVQGLVGISRDITAHVKRAEELEDQRARINQFTRYVSHDLKNPLNMASGALQMARESGDESDLQNVADALERMDETIDDLSNLINRKSPPELQQDQEKVVDLATARGLVTPRLAEVAEDVWDLVGVESATLEVDVPPETTITAEEESIRPLLENLMKNAIDHGGDDVTIRIGLTDESGFYVEDDGDGIPKDERERVLADGYTTSNSGTGTGLSIVADVAEECGWTVSIDESEAGGARIEFNGCLIVPTPPRAAATGEPIAIDGHQSVGDVVVAGSAEYAESIDRWIVEGGGKNIWEYTNDFHFAFSDAESPVRIQGRIADLDPINQYSKAGFMIRDDLSEDATFGYVGQTPGYGTELLWCEQPGGRTLATQLEDPPDAHEWYRIEYRDGVVTCSVSGAGKTWRHIGQLPVDLGDTVTVGLVVCSHEEGRSVVAQFEGVEADELAVE